MTPLHGEVAVVAGASKGIGAEAAIELASDGGRVVVILPTSDHEARQMLCRIEAAGGTTITASGGMLL